MDPPPKYSTKEERAERRRQQHDEAEQKLAAKSARIEAQNEEDDPFGVGVALFNMRAMAEDAAEEIEERQINQAMVAERREAAQRVRQAQIRRRQDYYEQRRRGIRRVMQQQLGHPPAMDDFIIQVSKMGPQDQNWSDDE